MSHLLKALFDDGNLRFIQNENLTAVATLLVPEPHWHIERPIALFQSCFHFLAYLALIGFAFIFSLRGYDGFYKFPFWAVLEMKIRGKYLYTTGFEFLFQAQMNLHITGKTFEIIEDKNKLFARVLVDVSDKCLHRWPFKQTTGDAFLVEGTIYNELMTVGKLTAQLLLRRKTGSFLGLAVG